MALWWHFLEGNVSKLPIPENICERPTNNSCCVTGFRLAQRRGERASSARRIEFAGRPTAAG